MSHVPSKARPDWSDIERAGNAGYYVEYLDKVTAQSEMQRYKRRSYDLLGPAPGARILEIGCGTGDDAIALAARVGDTGAVVGLDHSASLIAEAQRRVEGRGLPVEFRVGDVHALDVSTASFDACRADRVFMHLGDMGQALAEMVRVTRPGGRVVVREPDWDTLILDGVDPARTRAILGRHFDRAIKHPRAGRALYRLFRDAGLVEVQIADCSTLVLTELATANQLYGLEVAASADPDGAAWFQALVDADRAGHFFSAVTGFTAVGTVA
jgi:SAM-dependent methyltransferase